MCLKGEYSGWHDECIAIDPPNGTAPEELAAIKNRLRRKTTAKINL